MMIDQIMCSISIYLRESSRVGKIKHQRKTERHTILRLCRDWLFVRYLATLNTQAQNALRDCILPHIVFLPAFSLIQRYVVVAWWAEGVENHCFLNGFYAVRDVCG